MAAKLKQTLIAFSAFSLLSVWPFVSYLEYNKHEQVIFDFVYLYGVYSVVAGLILASVLRFTPFLRLPYHRGLVIAASFEIWFWSFSVVSDSLRGLTENSHFYLTVWLAGLVLLGIFVSKLTRREEALKPIAIAAVVMVAVPSVGLLNRPTLATDTEHNSASNEIFKDEYILDGGMEEPGSWVVQGESSKVEQTSPNSLVFSSESDKRPWGTYGTPTDFSSESLSFKSSKPGQGVSSPYYSTLKGQSYTVKFLVKPSKVRSVMVSIRPGNDVRFNVKHKRFKALKPGQWNPIEFSYKETESGKKARLRILSTGTDQYRVKTVVIEETPDPVRSGEYSQEVVVDRELQGIRSAPFSTVSDWRYRVSAWVYPLSADSVALSVRQGDDLDFNFRYHEFKGLEPKKWNHIEKVFRERSGGSNADVRLLGTTRGKWYFDDVSVVRETSENFDLPKNELFAGKLPNVYYFILDAYSRLDMLAKHYGYDNSDFIDYLTTNNFWIGDKSHSNYRVTAKSVNTTLYMNYVLTNGEQVEQLDPNDRFYSAFFGSKSSPVMSRFRDHGYTIFAATHTGRVAPDCEPYCIRGEQRFDMQEIELLKKTPVLQFLQLFSPESLHDMTELSQQNPLNVLDKVNSFTKPEPFFLFAHILSPHPPYLYKGDCSLRDTFRFDMDPVAYDRQDLEKMHRHYVAQLTCLNTRMRQAIDTIVTQDPDAIIVVQSDHGLGKTEKTNERTDRLRARYAILNAFRVPGRCQSLLYPQISSVNTFRVLFSCLEGGDRPAFENLPDKAYYYSNREKLMEDVTNLVVERF